MFITKYTKNLLTYLKALVVFTLLLPWAGISVSFAQGEVAARDLSPSDLPGLSQTVSFPNGRQAVPGSATIPSFLMYPLSITQTADERNDPGQELGRGVEVSLLQSVQGDQMGYHIDVASLENTIDTSAFSPPSPDPAGIAYITYTNSLLISDSEVNEMPIYAGANLFETTLSGSLVYTGTTIPFSFEPTGVAYNPADGHIFLSDDNKNEVFEVDPGVDGRYGTTDDTVTSFDTATFGGYDPTGVAFDRGHGHLFVVDGVGKMVYQIAPGINGVFDGVPGVPDFGDDVVTDINIAQMGLVDPEGIEYKPDGDGGTLFIGDVTDVVVEMTTSGVVIRVIDISAANGDKVAGISLAPGSADSTVSNLYITDRGVDNNTNPNENDGKVYEMSFPAITPGNLPPTVNAGTDDTIDITGSPYLLDGTVDDDGLPTSVVTTTWSQVSGPWTVEFADTSVVTTTATFSEPGTYVLRLTADDGELAPSDEVTITVTSETGIVTELRVDTSSDDAEERTTGWVWVTSPDLDLVYDAPSDNNQIVGIRFNGVSIPQGATIVNAYIQFRADETDAGASSLTIEGQYVDHAPTFTSTRWDISSRVTTTASVLWTPAQWTRGEAGFDQRTSNIAPILQEIVDRDGWSSCNSLAIIFTGSGERVAESYDGLPNAAPLLHIYTDSGEAPVNQAQCVLRTSEDWKR